MNKKFEYHKEYPDAVYKDRIYKWFTNSTRNMSDAELQRFVDLYMRGNLTFQCADEIDIDDPDISMIDHLLMDIASEKNDELIDTYTDEVDWDNDYIEKYNKGGNIDRKKLEARIARLEKVIKNEQYNDEEYLAAYNDYCEAISKAQDAAYQLQIIGEHVHEDIDEAHFWEDVHDELFDFIPKYSEKDFPQI